MDAFVYMAAITNYQQFGGLKPQKCFLYSPGDKKSEASVTGLCSPGRPLRRFGSQHFTAAGSSRQALTRDYPIAVTSPSFSIIVKSLSTSVLKGNM